MVEWNARKVKEELEQVAS